jgi:hypothetical protein
VRTTITVRQYTGYASTQYQITGLVCRCGQCQQGQPAKDGGLCQFDQLSFHDNLRFARILSRNYSGSPFGLI